MKTLNLAVCLLAGAVAVSVLAGQAEKKVIGSISVKDKSAILMASLAKLTVDEAIRIVQGKVEGKIVSTKLENEDGFLVYTVRFVKNGLTHEAIVDAGDGKILAVNPDDNKNSGDDDDDE